MSSLAAQRVDCFSVFSVAEPSALLRILEAVSLLGVLPSRCHSAPLESDPAQLVVDFQIAGLPSERAQLLAKRLGRVITVTQVLHSEKHCAPAFRNQAGRHACGRGVAAGKVGP